MSATTNPFQEKIEKFLNEFAMHDELFAKSLKKENKSITECLNYIISEVEKTGRNGFDDKEIFNMAVHYYDEDSIKDIKPIKNCRVVVNEALPKTETPTKPQTHTKQEPKKEIKKEIKPKLEVVKEEPTSEPKTIVMPMQSLMGAIKKPAPKPKAKAKPIIKKPTPPTDTFQTSLF
jgi:hypothetical protein